MGTGERETPDPPEETSPGTPDNTPRRTKPATLWLAAALVTIAVVAALSSAVHTYRAEQRRRAQRTPAEPAPQKRTMPDVVGSEHAGLKIEACLGPCIEASFDPLAKCAEAWPDKVRAEFIPYMAAEGTEFVSEHGEEVACICFNGETRFTLGDGDTSREVHLSGPPGGQYKMSDLVEVLRMQMGELYGELPPDFEEQVRVFDESVVPPNQADGD